MAASTPSTKAKADQDEVDEMFGKPAPSDDDFAGLDDLLDEVEEDDSEGWVPTERGEAIVGVVVKVGETRSDFATSEADAMCPTVTLECKDPDKAGSKIKYRVIGYGTVLKREMLDADPKVGDRMAVKYFGEKVIKKGKWQGKNYKHFGIVVKRKGE